MCHKTFTVYYLCSLSEWLINWPVGPTIVKRMTSDTWQNRLGLTKGQPPVSMLTQEVIEHRYDVMFELLNVPMPDKHHKHTYIDALRDKPGSSMAMVRETMIQLIKDASTSDDWLAICNFKPGECATLIDAFLNKRISERSSISSSR